MAKNDPLSNTPLAYKHVVQLDANGFYQGMVMVDEDPLERGTFQLPPMAHDITPPTLQEGQIAQWNEQGQSWVYHEANPKPSLDILRKLAILNVDLEVDRIYAQVVGLRGEEYAMAENEARTFLIDPEQEPPASVADLALIKAIDPVDAATLIVTQADNWRNMSVRVIRPARLQVKESMRAADTTAEIELLEQAWLAKVAEWRTTLGIDLS